LIRVKGRLIDQRIWRSGGFTDLEEEQHGSDRPLGGAGDPRGVPERGRGVGADRHGAGGTPSVFN